MLIPFSKNSAPSTAYVSNNCAAIVSSRAPNFEKSAVTISVIFSPPLIVVFVGHALCPTYELLGKREVNLQGRGTSAFYPCKEKPKGFLYQSSDKMLLI